MDIGEWRTILASRIQWHVRLLGREHPYCRYLEQLYARGAGVFENRPTPSFWEIHKEKVRAEQEGRGEAVDGVRPRLPTG